MKEFLDLRDKSGLKAYDYCKIKKRTDLAVVLGEFVDTSKSVVEIQYELVNYDFKANARTVFNREIEATKNINTMVQYIPYQEPFLRSELKIKLEKCPAK